MKHFGLVILVLFCFVFLTDIFKIVLRYLQRQVWINDGGQKVYDQRWAGTNGCSHINDKTLFHIALLNSCWHKMWGKASIYLWI